MVVVPMSRQPPAPSCSRSRARPGGAAAAGEPAPVRAFVRLDPECLPARDRCRGDHRHDPCAARPDDARQRRPRALRPGPAGQADGSAARRNRRPARPHLAASRDCGSTPLLAGVVGAAQTQKSRRRGSGRLLRRRSSLRAWKRQLVASTLAQLTSRAPRPSTTPPRAKAIVRSGGRPAPDRRDSFVASAVVRAPERGRIPVSLNQASRVHRGNSSSSTKRASRHPRAKWNPRRSGVGGSLSVITPGVCRRQQIAAEPMSRARARSS
jgi:hypothetical protein